jgi:nitroreductase
MSSSLIQPVDATELASNTAYTAVADAIRQRRTIKQFVAQPVPRGVIQELIELAVWAPNHRLTEPWRFYVLDGAALVKLGEIASQVVTKNILGSGGEIGVATRKGEEAAATWSAIPAALYVTTLRDENPEIDEENYGAVCCAIQNLSLAAHAAGLATSWASGAVVQSPLLHEYVGAGANEKMVGLIRIGYPDPTIAPPKARRKDGSSVTTWVNGE